MHNKDDIQGFLWQQRKMASHDPDWAKAFTTLLLDEANIDMAADVREAISEAIKNRRNQNLEDSSLREAIDEWLAAWDDI